MRGRLNRPSVRPILVWGGFAVSALFAYLAARGVDWGKVWDTLRESNYWWLVPAFGLLALAVLVRAERWRSLFAPGRRPRFGPVLAATLIGYLFTNILPARAGEAARVVALNRSTGVSRAETIATVVIERIYDVIGLLVLLFVLAPWYPHVGWFRAAAAVAIALGVGLAAAAVVLAVYGERALQWILRPLHRLPFAGAERIDAVATSLTHGLVGLRHSRVALIALVLTVLSWVLLAFSTWCVSEGVGLGLSPLAGVLIVISWNLVLVLPSSPAGLGVFEAAVVAAAGAYDVPRAQALSLALVLHALNFVPYIVAGSAALLRSRGASRPALGNR